VPPTLVPTQLSITNTPMLAPSALPTATGLATIAATCDQPAGQLIDDSFTSKNAHGTVAYRIYLPPCYWQSGRRYPLAILLPDASGDQTQWTTVLHLDRVLDRAISSGSLPPLIAVMPEGGTLAAADQFKAGASFATLITDELIPTVDQRFCTWGSRDGRTIGGVGSGGFWAYQIGIQHPDLFNAIGAHSPTFSPAVSIARSALPSGADLIVLAGIVKFPAGKTPRLTIDSTLDDPNRALIDQFVAALIARQLTIGHVLYPSGLHGSALWAAHVGDDLAFYSKGWPLHLPDLPSCLQ